MNVCVDLKGGQSMAAHDVMAVSGDASQTVEAGIEADASEYAVTERAMRVLQLQDDARSHFEAAEENLASVRHTFDRVLARDIEPELEPVAEPVLTQAVVVPVSSGRSSLAMAAVLAIASMAVTVGLVVSLNAATPGNDTAVAMTHTAASTVPVLETGSIGPVAGEPEDFGATVYAARFANAPAAERMCLARAVYYEARGEAMDGQIAVAQVVLNRVRSKKWPSTICGVVNQGIERGEKCQFSFACFTNLTPPNGEKWEQALQVAEQAVNGQAWLRELAEATYYHTMAVAPVWRTTLTQVATIGTHIFYRDGAGLQASAFDEGRYQAAVQAAPVGPAVDAARAKAAAAAKARAKLAGAAGGAPKKALDGGSSDDWKSGVFSR